MPMNTTLERRRGRASRMATATCSTISPPLRWRWNPACPVAQNWHAMAHPAWVDTQTVTRSAYSMSTVSTWAPSASDHSHLVVNPLSAVRRETSLSAGDNAAPSDARNGAGRSVISSGRCTRTCSPSHTCRAR